MTRRVADEVPERGGAQLRPLFGDGSVCIGGAPILQRTIVPRGSDIAIGPFVLAINYP